MGENKEYEIFVGTSEDVIKDLSNVIDQMINNINNILETFETKEKLFAEMTSLFVTSIITFKETEEDKLLDFIEESIDGMLSTINGLSSLLFSLKSQIYSFSGYLKAYKHAKKNLDKKQNTTNYFR